MSGPVYDRFGVTVYQGDGLDVMREMPDASVHAVVTDGTGAINIAACRVGMRGVRKLNRLESIGYGGSEPQGMVDDGGIGRWPPNTIFSHVPALDPVSGEVVGDACADGCVDKCAVAELDRQSGQSTSMIGRRGVGLTGSTVYGSGQIDYDTVRGHCDSGGASRYFPCFRHEIPAFVWASKAPTAERPRVNGKAHETVKPLNLCRFLVRLVAPPGGTVLDCFAGTGTTGQAARAEGFKAVLIENDPSSIPLIVARLDAKPRTDAPTASEHVAEPDLDLFGLLSQDDAS